jgi:hypothetical protein
VGPRGGLIPRHLRLGRALSLCIVLAAGILGYTGGRLAPDKFRVGGGHGASDQTYGPALLDNDLPLPGTPSSERGASRP